MALGADPLTAYMRGGEFQLSLAQQSAPFPTNFFIHSKSASSLNRNANKFALASPSKTHPTALLVLGAPTALAIIAAATKIKANLFILIIFNFFVLIKQQHRAILVLRSDTFR